MKTIQVFLYSILALLAATYSALSAETNAVKLTQPQTNPGKLYADTRLSLRTPNFTSGDYSYAVGIGYQATSVWAVDAQLAHHGLDGEGSAIQDLGARVVARLPFKAASPYTFLGAAFDLEQDEWRLRPGAGIELGVSRRLRGLSVFAEGGLDANLRGQSGYLFSSGLRWRF